MLPQISDLFRGCDLLSMYLLLFFFLFPWLLVFQKKIDGKEKADFREDKSDNKEQAPPFVNGDMLCVFW